MRLNFDQIVALAGKALLSRGISAEIADAAARNCAWLEACGYPGLKLLQEVQQYVKAHGRVFLRNVRHGLYLLPLAVGANIGIGCPVDPSFALGGERSKNPYAEKLEIAARDGIAVDDALWHALEAN